LWSFFAPFAGLLVVAGVFSALQWPLDRRTPFLTPDRLALVAKQSAIVGVGALGMTVVIIAGGIDLSAGSTLALCAVTLALSLKQGWPAPLAVLLVLVVGLLAGVINGLLVTVLRLVPFIATLGTMLAFRGAAEWVSASRKIQADAPAWLSTLLDPPAKHQYLPTGVWIVLLLGGVLAIVLSRTVFGRYVFAIGSNEATARLCGIRVPAVKVAVYGLVGLFMALAGIFDFNDLSSQGSPTAGLGLELSMIAAVVIGGGSLSGGRGSVLGSLIGAVTMALLRNGCVYAGVSDPMQKVIIGGIILAAVTIDRALASAR
jgi:ribose/xylose/arabinose/galactoside ABC-type transport system permease subunit